MVHFIACLFIHFFLTMRFFISSTTYSKEKKESLYTTLISSFTETFIIIIKTYSILFVITFIGLFLGFQVIGIKQALNLSFFIAFFDFFSSIRNWDDYVSLDHYSCFIKSNISIIKTINSLWDHCSDKEYFRTTSFI